MDARLKAQPEFMSLIQERLAEIHWPMICSRSDQLITMDHSWFKKIYELGISSPLSPDITGGLEGMHYKLSSFNCKQAGGLPFFFPLIKLLFQELVRHQSQASANKHENIF